MQSMNERLGYDLDAFVILRHVRRALQDMDSSYITQLLERGLGTWLGTGWNGTRV